MLLPRLLNSKLGCDPLLHGNYNRTQKLTLKRGSFPLKIWNMTYETPKLIQAESTTLKAEL